MGQPIRKDIVEKRPELLNDKPFVTLLVDGNNLLRISMADTKTNTKGEHYGGVFQFLLQLRIMINKIGSRLDYIYVFFDDHDSGILRYNIYNDYKANRDKDYANSTYGKSEYWKKYEESLKGMQRAIYNKKKELEEERKFIDAYKVRKIKEDDIINKFGEKEGKEIIKKAKKEIDRENFDREREIILKCLNELYIRWVFDENTEGDDLIAYYVKNKKPNENIIIMSTDHDLTQLISDDVCVFDKELSKHNKKDVYLSQKNFKKHRGIPVENVVTKKILLGDDSDNIKGINGLSENRLLEIMPEIAERPVSVQEIRDRAKLLTEERLKEKKKPLKWQENIVNGVSNGNYDGDFYEINEKIISLKHPLMTEEAENEMKETMYAVQDPEGRSFGNLYNIMKGDGIDELADTNRFSTFFEPFKPIIDREIRRYKKYVDAL